MTTKHNNPKRGRRSKSRYRARLAARGLKSTPVMASAEDLAKVQAGRERLTGHRWWERGDGTTGDDES
jgi:hypothetical protein